MAAGEAGRLINVSIEVGMGVLDGRWVRSNSIAGNGFGIGIGSGATEAWIGGGR